jgi:hypothetical protein
MATTKTANPAIDKARISNIGNVPRNIDFTTDEWCGFHESNMDLRREPRRSTAELNPHKTKPQVYWGVPAASLGPSGRGAMSGEKSVAPCLMHATSDWN